MAGVSPGGTARRPLTPQTGARGRTRSRVIRSDEANTRRPTWDGEFVFDLPHLPTTPARLGFRTSPAPLPRTSREDLATPEGSEIPMTEHAPSGTLICMVTPGISDLEK